MASFVRLKAQYAVSDDSGQVSIVFWDKLAVQLIGKTAAELKALSKEVMLKILNR